MALQNRVDPFGRLMRDPGRGTMTGNRGILHDDHQRIVRSHATKAWITCCLYWKGWRRRVMTGRTWTELFFLDEATALAAGHRPCGYCRRNDYNLFVDAWGRGNPTLAPSTGRRAPVVDAVLHRERRRPNGSKQTSWSAAEGLPIGTMVVVAGRPHLVTDDEQIRPWSFGGYGPRRLLPPGRVEVLTPASTVRALGAGYHPAIHATIEITLEIAAES